MIWAWLIHREHFLWLTNFPFGVGECNTPFALTVETQLILLVYQIKQPPVEICLIQKATTA